jgi:hypothetical protein
MARYSLDATRPTDGALGALPTLDNAREGRTFRGTEASGRPTSPLDKRMSD